VAPQFANSVRHYAAVEEQPHNLDVTARSCGNDRMTLGLKCWWARRTDMVFPIQRRSTLEQVCNLSGSSGDIAAELNQLAIEGFELLPIHSIE
jgi:hypothetical protein